MAGTPLVATQSEHAAVLAALERLVPETSADEVHRFAVDWRQRLQTLFELEETRVYPELLRYLPGAAIDELREDHVTLSSLLDVLASGDAEDARTAAADLRLLLQHHVHREDEVIAPLVARLRENREGGRS